jgi:hypothetical protein
MRVPNASTGGFRLRQVPAWIQRDSVLAGGRRLSMTIGSRCCKLLDSTGLTWLHVITSHSFDSIGATPAVDSMARSLTATKLACSSTRITPTSYQNNDPSDYFNLKAFRAAPGSPRRPPEAETDEHFVNLKPKRPNIHNHYIN